MPITLSPIICTLPSARHYNSALSIWLSVDPLADKYPGLSPYTYCANNPVRLVDPDGREIIANKKNRKETKEIMKRYFCEHFGTSEMFYFKLNGRLAIRKSKFQEALAAANCEQEQLLLGMQEAIQDKNHIVEIRITDDICELLPIELSLCTGENSDGTQKVETEKWDMPVGEHGGGCTYYSKKSDKYLIGISDALSNQTKCSTGQDGVFTGSGSATFFHEVLDEFLNYYVKRVVTDSSPKIEKVFFQNEALKNLGLPSRDGQDHQ